MDRHADPTAQLEGAAAPPRKNGELVFDAPWESRAFGMAVALHGAGAYEWKEFSDALAGELAAKADHASPGSVFPIPPDAEAAYYERWLASLESLLVAKGILSREELEARTAEFEVGMWDEH